ncbi:hypothetical protein STA3757_15520 [Stanieria sp. NIES-3757]|nr:hypothetical protein STA3757_15520 [Stanieria sp. NIES-3757]
MILDKPQFQILAWIAIPRTGTNFLCSLMYHHPLITSYYEIFHPQQFHAGYKSNTEGIIKYINQKYCFNFLNAEDTNLIQWIRNNPSELIDILVYFNPERHISFKLFPDHLDKKMIESAIIKNKNIKKILVKRDLLAAYISHEIALKTNRWNNFDTSQIQISLSVEKFEKWVNRAEQWYEFFESYHNIDKQGYFVINYEDIHAHKTNLDKLKYLDNFLKNIGIEFPKEYQLPSENYIKILKKQDTRANIEEKIINYKEFVQGIEDKSLSQYLPDK